MVFASIFQLPTNKPVRLENLRKFICHQVLPLTWRSVYNSDFLKFKITSINYSQFSAQLRTHLI